jgi:hypothetical protein
VGRIVTTYLIDGHRIAVLETLDEEGAWFELVVDGAAVPVGEPLTAVPSEEIVAEALRRWLNPTPT